MSRWSIKTPKKSIEWLVKQNDFHTEDLEMSGFGISHTVKYGVDENGTFFYVHHPAFPTLRCRPNDTHATYQLDINPTLIPSILLNGNAITEKLTKVTIDGTLILETTANDLKIIHHCFPSTTLKAAYEIVSVTNLAKSSANLAFTTEKEVYVDEKTGCKGICIAEVFHNATPVTLLSGETYTYQIAITGRLANEKPHYGDAKTELDKRYETILRLIDPMQIDTGCDVLDTMFTFAKIRSGESVFDTMNGLMHSPGGYSYYAATWCNDQVEYAGPYFAYTGDKYLIEASYNAYKMYTPFMSQKYTPIPSSVIAEGVDFWNGAGDRGDAAMYLYGASYFALICGNLEMARDLLPAIRWCIEYCHRKTNGFGVIESDSDELEGRFPSGKANLCTNTLCYAGLLAAAALEREIGNAALAQTYLSRAAQLKQSIDQYFARTIHGMDTYAYYEDCKVLRSWICMPLCVGIYERAQETVKALASSYLMTEEGLLTEEGCPTVWDRSTLYGLRGMFASGHTEKATELLFRYSEKRLLGERVPYAVEAYPEGGKRHLSGESALFCKVITEGILAMRPTGLKSFTLNPVLPTGLDHLYLTNIKAFGSVFGVKLTKEGFTVIGEKEKVLATGSYGTSVTVCF